MNHPWMAWIVPSSWRDAVWDDLREEARASGHGRAWLAWHVVRTGLRLRWTIACDMAAADLGYALRSLRRHGVFTVAAIVLLAVGIGVNGALFSLLDALMLRPLPVAHAGTLVRLTDEGRDTFTYPDFERIRDDVRLVSDVFTATSLGQSRRVEIGDVPVRAAVQEVSPNYFDALGIQAAHGRVPRESDAGDVSPAVISDRFWRQHYGGDSAAIGSTLTYLDRVYVVTGVTPAGFRGVHLDVPADIWLPIEQTLLPGSMMRTRGRFLHVMGRLAADTPPAQASAEASALLERPIGVSAGATGFSTLRGRFGRPLLALQIIVALVLLLACANLASVMLARGSARQREYAMRLALGASRARVMRQVLTEGLVVSAAGGIVAFAVAAWLSAVLLRYVPPRDASALESLAFRFDIRLALVMAMMAVATGVACAFLPALRASRVALPVGSAGGGIQATGGPGGRPLVGVQVAMCTGLLVAAGLFGQSLRNLWSVDAGFEVDRLVVADVMTPERGPRDELTPARLDELAGYASRVPGARAVGFIMIGQMTGYGIEYPVYVPGHTGLDVPVLFEQRISPGFLEAMGTPLLSGRDFDDRDRRDAPPVAIVNESFVRRFLGDGPALGARFGNSLESSSAIEVVGVVRDAKVLSLREEPRPMYYRPLQQFGPPPSVMLALRTDGDPHAAQSALGAISRELNERVTMTEIVPFTEVVARTIGNERMLAHASSALALLAVLVAAAGLYGTFAYRVASRTREIGVRMALGATRRDVHWMVQRECLLVVGIGVPVGVLLAAAGTSAVRSMLYGLAPTDLATIAIAVAVMAGVALAATAMPALRATRIEPTVALKDQ